MKKLSSKVFNTLFLIISISLFSFFSIFNIQSYIEKRDSVINSLNSISFRDKDMNRNNIDNIMNNDDIRRDNIDDIKYMDSVMYTILIDNDNNIKEVINHSNDDISESEIRNKATSILSNISNDRYIGNLYFNRYSYLYRSGDSLVIIDNYKINNNLRNTLFISLIIFGVLEFISFMICRVITNWIIKPVNDSFNRQKEFICDASHELKTPLSVIIASGEAMEVDNDKKWLNNILIEANKMNKLVSDLLKLASTERVETFNFKDGNLSQVVTIEALTFEGRAYERGILFNLLIEDDIFIRFDSDSISRLVSILLDNAIEHSDDNESIDIILKNNGDNVKLLVINKGDVIEKGEEDKIFERFYRSDKSRNRNSNRFGLGLSIAKNIVISHNGSIRAYSKDGKTYFEVMFRK